jgi:methylmalonyl-CoA mutase C-terminal domain/subunit
MEVTYLGKYQTPEAIVQSALQEDADVIGISCLSSNYRGVIKVMDLLKQKSIDNILVIVGGTIPQKYIQELKNAGVSEVFTPGSELDSIATYITSKSRKSNLS